MAGTLDMMKIAVMIQDLTAQGARGVQKALEKIPSQLSIQGSFHAKGLIEGIRNLGNNTQAAAQRIEKFNAVAKEAGAGNNALNKIVSDFSKLDALLTKVNAKMHDLNSRGITPSGHSPAGVAKNTLEKFISDAQGAMKSGDMARIGALLDGGFKAKLTNAMSTIGKTVTKHDQDVRRAQREAEKAMAQAERVAEKARKDAVNAEMRFRNSLFKIDHTTDKGFVRNLMRSFGNRSEKEQIAYQRIAESRKADVGRQISEARSSLLSMHQQGVSAGEISKEQQRINQLVTTYNMLSDVLGKMYKKREDIAKRAQKEEEKAQRIQQKSSEKARKEAEKARNAQQKAAEREANAQRKANESRLKEAQRLRESWQRVSGRSRTANVRNADLRTLSDARLRMMQQGLSGRISTLGETYRNAKSGWTMAKQAGDVEAMRTYRNVARQTGQELGRLQNMQRKVNVEMGNRATRHQRTAMQQARDAAASFRQQLQGVNSEMRNTTGFASQMGDAIREMFSFYALRQFLHNLIDIGGQFEYQRAAIKNILQDGTKANILFEQIKDLGVHSPFSTLQLDQYAKQLSAFDIPYHDLFNTLKKLADISAGTGADLSRIILAYGHVKSEGFLTGMQRRQFSNANINMVGGLAKYYSKQRGMTVSKRDVYDMISNKEVPFEDMHTVLMSMAEEGGQFYEMQETMSNTVKGVWKNTSDAINHMYLSIEQSNSALLMSVGKSITWLFKLFEKYPTLVSSVISATAVWLTSKGVYAAATDRESASIIRKIALLDKERTAMLRNTKAYKADVLQREKPRNLLYRIDNAFTGRRETTRSSMTYLAGQMKSDPMVKQMAIREIQYGRLDKEAAKYLVRQGALTASEARNALTVRLGNFGLVRRIGVLSRLAGAARMAGTAIKSLFASMLPILAISAAFEMIYRLFDKGAEAQQTAEYMQTLADSIESLSRALDELQDVDFGVLDRKGRITHIKELIDEIKNNVAGADVLISQLLAKDSDGNFLKSETEIAEGLLKILQDSLKAKKALQESGDPTGVDGDDFKEEWGDYRDSKNSISRTVNSILDNYKTHRSHAAFIEGLRHLNKYQGMTDYDILMDIFTWSKTNFKHAQQGVLNHYLNYPTKRRAAENSIYQLQSFHDDLSSYAIHSSIAKSYNNALKAAKAQGVTDKEGLFGYVMAAMENYTKDDATLKQFVSNYVMGKLGMQMGSGGTTYTPQMHDLLKQANNAQTKDSKAVAFLADDSYVSAIDKVSTAYEKLKGNLEKLGEMDGAEKLGLNHKDLKYDKELALFGEGTTEGLAGEINEQIKIYNNLVKVLKILGLTYKDLEKSKKGEGDEKDLWLEKMKLRIDRLKKASQLYLQMEPTLGSQKALNRIKNNEEFKDLFSDWSDVDLSSLTGAMQELLLDKEWEKTDKRKKAKLGYSTDMMSYQFKDTEKDLKLLVGRVSKYLDDNRNRLSIYERIYKATGDREVSSLFAYGVKGLSPIRSKRELIKDFDENIGVTGFTYDEALKFTEEDWRQKGTSFKSMFESTKQAVEQLDEELISFYEHWKQNDKRVESQKRRIISDYNAAITYSQLLAEDGKISTREQALMNAQAAARISLLDSEMDLQSIGGMDLVQFMENPMKLLKVLEERTRTAFDIGVLSAEEFHQKMEQIRKGTDAVNKLHLFGMGDNTTAFAKGGLPGLIKHLEAKIKAYETDPRRKNAKDNEEYKKSKKQYNSLKNTQDGLEDFSKVLDIANNALDGLQKSFQALADMFDALGNKRAARTMMDVSDYIGIGTSVLSPVTGVVQSALSGDIGGLVSNAIQAPVKLFTGPITAIAKLHDKKISEAIEDSKERLDALRKDYKLLQIEMGRSYDLEQDDALESYQSLIDQEAELNTQLEKEKEKKKSDSAVINQLETELAEMSDQIKYYWSDVLKNTLGLDFENYGKRLGEALWNAFQEGEDAALAWKRTVGDIIRELGQQMAYQKFIAPAFENAFTHFFGEDGKGGLFGGKTTFTESDAKEVGKYLTDGMEGALSDYELWYKAIQSAFPNSSNSGASGGLSKIGQNLTEDTGSVIASYVNAIRYDGSVRREYLLELKDKMIPLVSEQNNIANSQLAQLKLISSNTAASATNSEEILALLRATVNGTKKMHMA